MMDLLQTLDDQDLRRLSRAMVLTHWAIGDLRRARAADNHDDAAHYLDMAQHTYSKITTEALYDSNTISKLSRILLSDEPTQTSGAATTAVSA